VAVFRKLSSTAELSASTKLTEQQALSLDQSTDISTIWPKTHRRPTQAAEKRSTEQENQT
jgi:hypothetical protein